MSAKMKRRELITLLGGAAVTWPLAAGAQQPIPVIGYLNNGFVASLNRSGGNLTGFSSVTSELGAKGLALLHELVPGTATIGFLENPNNPTFELTTRDVLAAAPVMGLTVQTLKASTDREIDAAFASLVQARTGALLVGNAAYLGRVRRLES
jgi:putative tryptophan/tyrosine transport system substrate-binding protein